MASERELCTSLFGSSDLSSSPPSSSSAAPPTAQPPPAESDSSAAVTSDADVMAVLDRVFDGVCRPFKVRVEQVLTSQPNLVLAYRLSTLLAFYNHTVREARMAWDDMRLLRLNHPTDLGLALLSLFPPHCFFPHHSGEVLPLSNGAAGLPRRFLGNPHV